VDRAARGLLSLIGICTAASTAVYLTSRPRPAVVPADGSGRRLAELEKRLAKLETTGPGPVPVTVPLPVRVGEVHKPFAVTHYEAMASQVAHERQIAELQRRLAAVERSRDVVRPLRFGAGGATTDRHHG
jgi:hypothetical protein